MFEQRASFVRMLRRGQCLARGDALAPQGRAIYRGFRMLFALFIVMGHVLTCTRLPPLMTS